MTMPPSHDANLAAPRDERGWSSDEIMSLVRRDLGRYTSKVLLEAQNAAGVLQPTERLFGFALATAYPSRATALRPGLVIASDRRLIVMKAGGLMHAGGMDTWFYSEMSDVKARAAEEILFSSNRHPIVLRLFFVREKAEPLRRHMRSRIEAYQRSTQVMSELEAFLRRVIAGYDVSASEWQEALTTTHGLEATHPPQELVPIRRPFEQMVELATLREAGRLSTVHYWNIAEEVLGDEQISEERFALLKEQYAVEGALGDTSLARPSAIPGTRQSFVILESGDIVFGTSDLEREDGVAWGQVSYFAGTAAIEVAFAVSINSGERRWGPVASSDEQRRLTEEVKRVLREKADIHNFYVAESDPSEV